MAGDCRCPVDEADHTRVLVQDLSAVAADALAMAAMEGVPCGIKNGKLELDDAALMSDIAKSQQSSALTVSAQHIEVALKGVKRRTASALGAPSVPKVVPSARLAQTLWLVVTAAAAAAAVQ